MPLRRGIQDGDYILTVENPDIKYPRVRGPYLIV